MAPHDLLILFGPRVLLPRLPSLGGRVGPPVVMTVSFAAVGSWPGSRWDWVPAFRVLSRRAARTGISFMHAESGGLSRALAF